MGDIAPESTLPYPPVHVDKKFVVLSDWYVFFAYLHSSMILLINDRDKGMARSRTTIPMTVSSFISVLELEEWLADAVRL